MFLFLGAANESCTYYYVGTRIFVGAATSFFCYQFFCVYHVSSPFQVVIVGNGAVGKSSLIQRYCKGIFTRNYKKTIGVDFLEKHIT